jgi:glycosyltransferase involved in cell wall biosynthesis
VNDGSEDGTGNIVRSFGDPRIRYVGDGVRRGQLRAFNRAILETLSREVDAVRLLCADDVLYPHDLAEMVRVFRAYPSVGLVATYFDTIDEDGRLIFRVDMRGRSDRIMNGRDYLLKGVAVGNTIGGPSSVAIRRDAIESAGLFDTRLDYSGDSDLWHRVAAAWDIAWIGPRVGLQYRVHGQSVTSRDIYSLGKFSDSIQIVRRVAATEAPFGPRWWAHQYTIGRLHAINLQVVAGMARRRQWQGVWTGIRALMREGLPLYAPFWIPRLPYQIIRGIVGLPVSRRLLLRRTHESLQPRFVAVDPNDAERIPEIIGRPDKPGLTSAGR